MRTGRSTTVRRAPRWLVLTLGILAITIGATLITRPFQSLAVLIILVAAGFILTGLNELIGQPDNSGSRATRVVGIAWLLLGIAILLWPGLSLQLLAAIVGIALIGSGVVRIVAALRDTADYRAASLLFGLAGMILGGVALLWPDITLLVLAVVFGVQLLSFGLARVAAALRRTPDSGAGAARPPGRLGGYVRTIGAALALLASLAVAGVSIALNRGAPVVDAFYVAPSQIPAEPGTLLRAEPMARALPPNAQAWRILYTTTRVDGSATVGSGIVVAPANLPDEPQPVIAWAHGTTGVEQTCAPSVLRDPFKAGATPALDQVVANGWVMVAADYIGLGTEGPHAYLIGAEGGRAVLDAVRAARQLPGLTLSEQTVVWGHSQGGGVALWTGILAPSYAPDANVIGVAALAPASDLLGLVSNLDVVPGGAIFVSYIIAGYSATYPDVRFDDYIRPTARILVREMASRCLSEPAALTSVIESLVIDGSVWATNPQLGALGARLSENTPTAEISVPLLIGQGLADPLVLPTVQAAYVEARCAAGGMVDYRTYEGFEHVSVVEEGSPLIPELLAWTQERLDGRPAASTC